MDLGQGMSGEATDYTIIVNTVIRDNRLSASDLGLLTYLLHLPDTWKIQPMQLADRFGCNRQTIYSRLKLLKDLEYVEYERIRKAGSFSEGQWKVSKLPYPKKPDVVNRTLLSTNDLLITKDTKEPPTDWREKIYADCPECVLPEAWHRWIDYKIEHNKNRPVSQRTVSMSKNRLIALDKKGFDTSGVIEVTINRNWKGIGDDSYSAYDRCKRDLAEQLII